MLALGLTRIHAQTIYLKNKNGTQTAHNLAGIKKITFSSGNLNITKSNNNSELCLLNDLRYISFSDYSTNISEKEIEPPLKLKVFPNPVQNILNIDISEKNSTDGNIMIYDTGGRLMSSTLIDYSGVIIINTSHFPKGIYICKFISKEEIKSVKIVKQ